MLQQRKIDTVISFLKNLPPQNIVPHPMFTTWNFIQTAEGNFRK